MERPFLRQRATVAVLATLLIGLGLPRLSCPAEAAPLTSILLVAQSDLDPNFADSVVLVMNNLGPAPVGVIINRPTRITISTLFPNLKRLAKLPDKLYFGGPVESGSLWFLFQAASAPRNAVQVLDGLCLSSDRALLLQLLARDKPLDGLRIFIGYSGWGPGQLEAEIAAGAWKLEHAQSDTIFNGQAEHPWPSAPLTPRRTT